MYVRALKWPIITWVVVDLVMLAAALLFGDIVPMMTPAVLAPLLLAFGLWAGSKIVEFGGGYGARLWQAWWWESSARFSLSLVLVWFLGRRQEGCQP